MSIVLQGSTSGSITLQEPAVAGSTVLSLPAVSGTILTTTSPKAGNVIQVVQGTSNTETGITSGSATDTGLSVSITPTSSSSKILVLVTQEYLSVSPSAATFFCGINIVRNSTTIYSGNRSNGMGVVNGSGITQLVTLGIFSMAYLDSPATTSSTTYKTQAFNHTTGAGYAIYLQNNASPSYITVMEIAA